jgi:PGF-pre-PGF domain-containing protein
MRIFLKLLSSFMVLSLLFVSPYPVSSGPDDGTGLIGLAENASIPVWSPNGGEILFIRNNPVIQDDTDYGQDIYKIDLNDSSEIRLTDFYYDEGNHVWSPDGMKILYSYEAADDFYLYIMNSDGSDNFELVKKSYGRNFSGISGCAWSPDGSRIAYISSDHNGSDRLVTLNPDGSNEQIVASFAEISALAWAPDSSGMAFNAAYSEDGQTGIYLADLESSEPVFLVRGEIRQQIQSWQSEVWSPDGSRILYSSNENGNSDTNENGNSDIYSVNTDGSEKIQLTDDNSKDYSPCFSPDGSKIIFISDRTGHSSIWIMSSNGDKEEELTEGFEGIHDFSWNPNGQKIAFSSDSNSYIQEIDYSESGDEDSQDDSSSDDSDNDTEVNPEYLHMEILSPDLNFAASQGTPELITVRITNNSGSPVQSSGFKFIKANFSNGDPELQLFDDGTHEDITASDGIFSNQWIPVNTTGLPLTLCILWASADHESLGDAEQIISGTISRKPIPSDLVIENISWSPADPYVNDNITFSITSANRGSGPSEACKVKCYINGNEAYSYSLPELEARSSTSIIFSWIPTAPGNIDVKAVVDEENQVSESVEENNEKSVSFSVKSLTPSTSSGKSGGKSSSSGGGGGGGGSPEPASNVRIKELSQQYITSGKYAKFAFPRNATCVTHVAFNSRRTAGKTTTIVEMLKNKSTRVPELPAGKIYENVNIWVGNKGTADPENIENAVVGFRVEKSWITLNDVDPASVRLWRLSSGEWEELSIRQLGEDDRYSYFEAQTEGFSHFVITAPSGENETIENALKSSIVPPVRSSAEVMEELFGKLSGKQNADFPVISAMSVNESGSEPEAPSTAGHAADRITGRGIIKVLVVIALLSVTGFLGSLILRKQN